MARKTTYNAADIQRYLNGEMAPAAMHALEQAALDDPFLEDALDGYLDKKSLEPSTINPDLDQLQARLSSRLRKEKRVISVGKFPVLRVAALLVLLAGAGLLVYHFISSNSTTKTEMAARKMEVQPETAADTVASLPAPMPDSLHSARVEPYLDKRSMAPSKNQVPPGAATPPSEMQKSSDAEERVFQSARPAAPNEKDALMKRNVESEIITDQSLPSSDKPSPVLQKERKTFASKEATFRTQVFTADSIPLAGALVVVGSDNEKAVLATNASGHANTTLQDSVVDVSVYSPGYQPYLRKVDNNGYEQPIFMKQEVALGNQSANAAKKRSSVVHPKISFVTKHADPAEGWTSYYNYLETSSTTLQPDPRYGLITISFNINTRGQLDNFESTAPAGAAISQQAIRLIREGPAWKTLGRQRGSATATFIF